MQYIRCGFKLSASDAGYYDGLNGYTHALNIGITKKHRAEYEKGFKIGKLSSKHH
jgi:hypothetical protein